MPARHEGINYKSESYPILTTNLLRRFRIVLSPEKIIF